MADSLRRPAWQIIIAWLVGLPLLYIAGFGPMARLTQDGYVSEGSFQIFYGPLMWIMLRSPSWMSNSLGLYLLLCGVRLG